MELALANAITDVLENVFMFIQNLYSGYFLMITVLFIGTVIFIYMRFFTKLLTKNPASR